MKRIWICILGISACTTLSLFAAKSDNVCPKCKAQSQVAAYHDDEEEATAPQRSKPAASTFSGPDTELNRYSVPLHEIRSPQGQIDYLKQVPPELRKSVYQNYLDQGGQRNAKVERFASEG